MLINLSLTVTLQKSQVAQWMLFPHSGENGKKMRELFHDALEFARIVDTFERYTEQDVILGEPSSWLPRMTRAYVTPKLGAHFLASHEQGFLSGLTLLVCLIFQNHLTHRYSSSLNTSVTAVESLTNMGKTKIRESHINFNSVAHIWAAYIANAPLIRDAVTEHRCQFLPPDDIQYSFIDSLDIDTIIADSMMFFDFGADKTKPTGTKRYPQNSSNVRETTLIDKTVAIRFSKPASSVEEFLHRLPESFVQRVLNSRRRSKLEHPHP